MTAHSFGCLARAFSTEERVSKWSCILVQRLKRQKTARSGKVRRNSVDRGTEVERAPTHETIVIAPCSSSALEQHSSGAALVRFETHKTSL